MVNVNIRKQYPKPVSGKAYTITQVTTTKTRFGDGIRIQLTDDNGNVYEDILWLKAEVGEKSKLGAFIKTLGNDENQWVGKHIILEDWSDKNRTVSVIEEKKRGK